MPAQKPQHKKQTFNIPLSKVKLETKVTKQYNNTAILF